MSEVNKSEQKMIAVGGYEKLATTPETVVVDGYAGLKKFLFALFVFLLITSTIGAFAIFGYISKDYYGYNARKGEADLALRNSEVKARAANLEAEALMQTNFFARSANREALASELKRDRDKIEKGLKDFEARIEAQKKTREAAFEELKNLYTASEQDLKTGYSFRTNELEQTFLTRKAYLDEQMRFMQAECARLRSEWTDYLAKTGMVVDLKRNIERLENQVEKLSKQKVSLRRQLDVIEIALVNVSTNLTEQARRSAKVAGALSEKEKFVSDIEGLRQQVQSWRDKEASAKRDLDKEESRLQKIESEAKVRKEIAAKELENAKKEEQKAAQFRQSVAISEADTERFEKERSEKAAILGKLEADIDAANIRLELINSQLKEKQKVADEVSNLKRQISVQEGKLAEEKGKLSALREEIARLNAMKDAQAEEVK